MSRAYGLHCNRTHHGSLFSFVPLCMFEQMGRQSVSKLPSQGHRMTCPAKVNAVDTNYILCLWKRRCPVCRYSQTHPFLPPSPLPSPSPSTPSTLPTAPPARPLCSQCRTPANLCRPWHWPWQDGKVIASSSAPTRPMPSYLIFGTESLS